MPGTTNSGGSETEAFCYDEYNRLVWAGNSGTPPGAGSGTCGSGPSNSLAGAGYSNSYVYTHLGQLWQGPLGGGNGAYQYLYCNSSQPHELSGLYAAGSTCSSKTGQGYASSYDGFGNVTGRTFSGTTATLSYDNLNHFTEWNAGSTNQEWYLYDAAGNRVLRRFTNSNGTTMIVYAFGLEEHTYSGAGAHQHDTYYYSLGGRLLGALDSNGTTFYLTDTLGSILASFNNAAGGASVKGNQVFGPYGHARYYKGTINTLKGFTGQYNDGSGLDYFHARYYDPVVGVFLSADSKQGNLQGMNPYAYVNGNPETHSDPTGQYIGTAIPLSQKGGAIAYTIPGTDLITTVINTGYIGSITTANGQVTSSSSGLTMNTFTRQQETLYGGYNPDTDPQNSPLAKLSQAIGLPQLQQTWSDPHATWLDKLMAIGNFAATNLNNVLQLAMIVGGGPEGEEVAAAVDEEESALAAGLKECGALSFTPATPVATAKGEQAIGTMKVGEKVWAYNPKTHKMELEPVLHVWINHDNDLVDLTLTTTTAAQHGKAATKTSEVIHTNKKHPFLTLEKGFLSVGQITVGMHVLRADGTYGVVTGWKVVPGAEVMYNLEVAQDHTFTVGTGEWVVHNHCGPGGNGVGFGDQNLLNNHFTKHNSEFSPPFANTGEYENAAVDFMTQGERPGLHEGLRWSDRATLRVDDSTGLFGIIRNGKITTFFIPDPAINGGFSPVDYFLNQIDELFF